MIPTGYKSDIPKTHSYPLGAKAVSDALAGVPQFDVLKIYFSQGWKGFARDRVPGAPYEVLHVSYGHTSSWEVRVRPVPRPLKHEIQGKLITEALPKIRKWLECNTHSLDREGGHRLTFFFDELSNELRMEEYSSSEWKTERA